ncbi:hypothetical protein K7G98_05845 [Saccharothrix sp. MB29]|nr:hypothetical protein [Saccharothrix sp. MB29]
MSPSATIVTASPVPRSPGKSKVSTESIEAPELPTGVLTRSHATSRPCEVRPPASPSS